VIVNTSRLFTRLLARLGISDVCDVGSLDGSDALRFRAALPGARIYALEPNPCNFQLMQGDAALRRRDIRILPWAASDEDGEAPLFLVDADYSRRDARRGMSSLYQRVGEWASTECMTVRTTRLDSFLAARCRPEARLALWIDSEGKAFEVIEGMRAIAAQVHLVHVEVETEACVVAGQKLYPQVRALLGTLGFRELATDLPPRAVQFNALFVRTRCAAGERRRIGIAFAGARLRHLLGSAAARACPGCLRRVRAARAQAV
jgi:FkbM family methyltransferase